MTYYIFIRNEVKGPYSAAALELMFEAKEISQTTLVSEKGGSGWKPYSEICGDNRMRDEAAAPDLRVASGGFRGLL